MNKTNRRVGVVSLVLVMLSIVANSRADREDAAAGRTITYTGYLEHGGTPVDGDRTFTFQLFESRTSGARLWPTSEGTSTVTMPVSAGRFVVELGGEGMASIPASALTIPELWLQVSVDGAALGGRQRVGTSRASQASGELERRLAALEAQRTVTVSFGGPTVDASECQASPCTIWRQSGEVAVVERVGQGAYDVRFTPGTFASTPTCACAGISPGRDSARICTIDPGDRSATYAGRVRIWGREFVASDGNADVICVGPR